MEIKSNRDERINAAPEFTDGSSLVSVTGLSLSSEDRFRRIIRQELFRQAMGREDSETFEEADDFELDDDEVWVSDYENEFEPMAAPVVQVDEPTPTVTTATSPAAAENPPPAGGNVSGQ